MVVQNKFLDLKIYSKFHFPYITKANLISLRTLEGELAICYNHTPLLSIVTSSIIRVVLHNTDKIKYLYISGGIVEVYSNVVSILSDSIIHYINDINKTYHSLSTFLKQNKHKASIEKENMLQALIRFKNIQIYTK